MDPDIYPDPEEFDPSRFTREARAARHPMAFQAFGMGQRNCVGKAFALLGRRDYANGQGPGVWVDMSVVHLY